MSPGKQMPLLTVEDVAERLRVSPEWVRQHANGTRRPAIPSVQIGNRRRFRPEQVEAFITSMEVTSRWA